MHFLYFFFNVLNLHYVQHFSIILAPLFIVFLCHSFVRKIQPLLLGSVPSMNFTPLFTKPLDYLLRAGTAFRDRFPIHGLMDFFCPTGIIPVKAGKGSTGGLVNSAVRYAMLQVIFVVTTNLCSNHVFRFYFPCTSGFI